MSRKGHGKVNQPKPLIATTPRGKFGGTAGCDTYMGPRTTGSKKPSAGGHVQPAQPMHTKRRGR